MAQSTLLDFFPLVKTNNSSSNSFFKKVETPSKCSLGQNPKKQLTDYFDNRKKISSFTPEKRRIIEIEESKNMKNIKMYKLTDWYQKGKHSNSNIWYKKKNNLKFLNC